MKNSILFAAVLGLSLGFSACSDDDIMKGGTNHAKGDVINFNIASRDSRTTYGDYGQTVNGRDDNWNIYWNFGQDQIRMFCDQTTEKSYDYTVGKLGSSSSDNGSGTKGSNGELIAGTGESVLHWNTGVGEEGVHHFYAVYPASNTYNVTNVSYTEEKDQDGKSYLSEHAVFKCPFLTTQTVTVAGSATNNVYTSTPDMSAQYMFGALDGKRKNVDLSSPINIEMKPVMTTLDVVVSRDADDKGTEAPMIMGVVVMADIPTTIADNNYFYYRVHSNEDISKNAGVCDESGNFLANWTDKSTATKKFTVMVNGGNLESGTGNGVELQKGESVTLTVFMPPVSVANPKFLVLGTNTGSVKVNTVSATLDASAKKKVLCNITDSRNSDWMAGLDNATYVQQVSIPGSNESVSYVENGDNAQSKGIIEQLDMGIRAFDIKVVNNSNITHKSNFEFDYNNDNAFYTYDAGGSSWPTQKKADKDYTLQELVVDILQPWLEHHSTEFIILQVNNTKWNSLWSVTLQGSFKDRLDKFSKVIKWDKKLTVNDARGHIIVMTRHGGEQSSIGDNATRIDGDFTATTDKNKVTTDYWKSLDVGSTNSAGLLYYFAKNSDDNYTTDNNGKDRFEIVKELLKKAAEDPETTSAPNSSVNAEQAKYPWFMTWLGGSTSKYGSAWGYEESAGWMHPLLLDYINNQTTPKPLGIIFMDCVGVQKEGTNNIDGKTLPAAIIANNFRADLKKDPNVTD